MSRHCGARRPQTGSSATILTTPSTVGTATPVTSSSATAATTRSTAGADLTTPWAETATTRSGVRRATTPCAGTTTPTLSTAALVPTTVMWGLAEPR